MGLFWCYFAGTSFTKKMANNVIWTALNCLDLSKNGKLSNLRPFHNAEHSIWGVAYLGTPSGTQSSPNLRWASPSALSTFSWAKATESRFSGTYRFFFSVQFDRLLRKFGTGAWAIYDFAKSGTFEKPASKSLTMSDPHWWNRTPLTAPPSPSNIPRTRRRTCLPEAWSLAIPPFKPFRPWQGGWRKGLVTYRKKWPFFGWEAPASWHIFLAG